MLIHVKTKQGLKGLSYEFGTRMFQQTDREEEKLKE